MSFGFGFALPAYPLRGGGGNNPFNQSGPTLDLSFVDGATNVGDQLGPDTYTLNTDFITPQYQVAAQYAVWVDGSGMTQRNFADIVTFTRASTGTFFNSAGTLTTAAINEARFDYDPSTLAARGLLIEEQRVNSIRNNTMQGAVAGTPGTAPTNWNAPTVSNGLAREIVGTGISNGITYVDIRYSGTTIAAGSTVIQGENSSSVVAATGQSWSASTWWAISGGSTANINAATQRVAGRSAAGTLLENTDTPVTLTATLTRYAVSRTMTNASTERVTNDILFSYNIGVAIDITLRIGLPQLEQGAFATSVIPTTTTALTRSADVASVNTLSPWFNATEGTLYAEYIATNAAQNNAAAALSDGTNNNRMIIRATNASSQTAFIGVSSGSSQWVGVITTALLNTTTKSAFGYKVDDIAWVRNGGTVGTDTPPAVIPTITGLKLGADGDGTLYLNGYIRRISYFPRRLANADLQTITT